VLDATPSDAWVSRLDRALDDEVHRVRPAVADGDRLYVRVNGVDEFDALTTLTDYIDAANALATATDRPSRGWRWLRNLG
jgi:hypothetical protein